MPTQLEKIFLAPRPLPGNTGILRLQPIDEASWIWHPAVAAGERAFLVFRREFDATSEPLTIHISADERYELFLDGARISRGPDRSDLTHWSYATYKISLPPGRHEFKVLAWTVQFQAAPIAQLSYRGGFVLKAEGAYDDALTTGKAQWQVARAGGWKTLPVNCPGVFGVGACFEWSGGMDAAEPEVPAKTVREPLTNNPWGCYMLPGWKLFPSTLPERLDRVLKPGRALAAGEGCPDSAFVFPPESATASRRPDWDAALRGRTPIVIPPHTREFVLVDLDDYYTGYSLLEVAGGRGATVSWGWAESLFLDPPPQPWRKGNRNEFVGKHFFGMTDTFPLDGAPRSLTIPWWRAGRYWLICVTTGADPLEIKGVSLSEERYPLEMEGRFTADDPELDAIQKICIRGMQSCAHETYMDCPFYEQLMYVGDTRLEMLTNHVMTRDARLVRRCIDLFDFSRVNWGFVNERYPSSIPQNSPTFSLIWTLMLHDFLFWRGAEPEWFNVKMTALRAMLEQFKPYETADGLLSNLPGWPFMDWVAGWFEGNPPGALGGESCMINLLYVLALQKAAELEDFAGEPLLAKRHRENAKRTEKTILARFWSQARNMLADDVAHTEFSEHAQALALLTDTVRGAKATRTFKNLLHAEGLRKASSYFSFYLFEAFRKLGRADLIQPRLEIWKEMLRLGCKTPLEAPEPSRSDCHAWSSQPLFHLFASIAGIRPASVGFKTVAITPQPGAWKQLAAALPHPAGGMIELKMTLAGDAYETRITLPPGVTGTLLWKNVETPIQSGTQAMRLPQAG